MIAPARRVRIPGGLPARPSRPLRDLRPADRSGRRRRPTALIVSMPPPIAPGRCWPADQIGRRGTGQCRSDWSVSDPTGRCRTWFAVFSLLRRGAPQSDRPQPVRAKKSEAGSEPALPGARPPHPGATAGAPGASEPGRARPAPAGSGPGGLAERGRSESRDPG